MSVFVQDLKKNREKGSVCGFRQVQIEMGVLDVS